MDDDATLAALARELEPVITEPEELIAQGLMPQIPYVKTARVPDGFERIAAHVVRTHERHTEDEAPITDRHLTMELGRTWPDHDDPDRPQVVGRRAALLAAASTEGADPDLWCAAGERVGVRIISGHWTRDRAAALARYEEFQALLAEAGA